MSVSPEQGKSVGSKKKQTQVSSEELPRRSLEQTIQIIESLHKTFAGKPTSWDDIAHTIGLGVKTNNSKYILWSAQAYGIIGRSEDNLISLTETGRKIVAPTYRDEDIEGKKKAILTPSLLSRFYSDYDGHSIPANTHFPNVLESKYSVPRERVSEAIEIIVANARYAGILDESSTEEQPIINLNAEAIDRALTSDLVVPDEPKTKLENKEMHEPLDNGDWKKTCFYITPIGDENSETRKHADMMLKHLVEPVLKEFNFEVIRADRIEKSGLITQQIFEHLVKSKLCIADLSFGNPNAFYELGVRHICKLPTIQIIRKGDKIPFDVSQGRTIIIDTSDIYTIMDRFESAKRELSEHVRNVLSPSYQDTGENNPVNYYLPGLKVTIQ